MRKFYKINLFANFKNMEMKNAIDKLAEMMQREFGMVKSEIDKLENKMVSKIDGLENKMDSRIDGLENKMDERFDEVLGREDKVFKRLEDLETDNIMGAGASKRQEDRLENHEERIVVTEEKLGIESAV